VGMTGRKNNRGVYSLLNETGIKQKRTECKKSRGYFGTKPVERIKESGAALERRRIWCLCRLAYMSRKACEDVVR